MRSTVLAMILVLSGCSEWGLRGNVPSSPPGPPSDDTDLGTDTAPPDDEGGGGALPTHCSPDDAPRIKLVWAPGIGPTKSTSHADEPFDFDDQGRMLWVQEGNLRWADRSGAHGILDPNGGYPSTASVRALPNGAVVVSSHGRIAVRDPDTGVTFLDLQNAHDERIREFDTVEVDTEGHIYTEFESGSLLRIPFDEGRRQTLADSLWPEAQLHRRLHFALTPDEEILYILDQRMTGVPLGATLFRMDRQGDEWQAPQPIWEGPNTSIMHGSLAVDECGNAIVSIGPTSLAGTEVWYIPLQNEAQLFLELPYWVSHMRWGNGRFGWDASTLYLWNWDSQAGVFRLHELPMGVKGNHVLTR